MENRKQKLPGLNFIKLYSWGFGKYGQIGTCNYQYTAEPHMIKMDNRTDADKIAKGSEIKQLFAGEFHSAYLSTRNQLYTYGKNTFGQLGHGNEDITYLPKIIKLDPKISILKVACGGEHTVALSTTNDLYSWGLNVFGQLGLGNTENINLPTMVMYFRSVEKNSEGKYEIKEWTRTVSDEEKVVDIAAGSQHSIIITNKNNFYSCGFSKNGSLGYAVEDSVDFSNMPTTLFTRLQNKFNNKKFLKVACGMNHSGIILEKNEILMWGKGETLTYDQLTIVSIPTVKIPGEDNLILDLKIGENFFAVLTKIGEVFTCGTNDHGELGVGSSVKYLKAPEKISLTEKIKSISVGYKFVIALAHSNKFYGWGSNRYGQLLETDTEKISFPKELNTLSQLAITDFVCGGYHTILYELGSSENSSIKESALAFCKMIKINKSFDPISYKQLVRPIEELEEKHVKLQADLIEKDKEIEKLAKKIEEKKAITDQINIIPQRDKRSDKNLKPKLNFNSWDEEIKFDELVFPNNCKVGIGTFGEVKKAYWRKTLVAVKFLKKMENEEENIKTFVEELNILKKLRHPNILLYIGACVTPPYYFLVTEYCENGNLFDYIHASSKRFTIKNKDRLKIALEIARGVNYLHSFNPPILHRDLKSLNILLDKNLTVKIADFGWARLRDIHMTKQRGTFQWMAPEVIKKNNYSEKADVYSYGIILWELWVQEPPYFNVDRVYVAKKVATDRYYRPQLNDEIPEEIQHLIVSCWDYDPDKRPTFEMVIEYLKEKAGSIL